MCFAEAAAAFAEITSGIPGTAWDAAGLGEWNVRDLVGHTSRALVTVENYLAVPPAETAPRLDDPVAYYAAVRPRLGDPSAVAERGRQAGRALGNDPAAAVGELVDRVGQILTTTADDAVLTTPGGAIQLLDYLPTRTFELTVHGLDLVRATGGLPPARLDAPLSASLELAARLAFETGQAATALLALTGRAPLPSGFSVI